MLAKAVCPWGVDIGCPFQSWNVFPSGTAVGVTVWGLEGHHIRGLLHLEDSCCSSLTGQDLYTVDQPNQPTKNICKYSHGFCMAVSRSQYVNKGHRLLQGSQLEGYTPIIDHRQLPMKKNKAKCT